MNLELASGAAAKPGAYEWVVCLDGKPVARFERSTVSGMIFGDDANVFHEPPAAWEIGSDGSLTFLAPMAEAIKRMKVTPAGGTNLASMIADAQANTAQPVADKTAIDDKAARQTAEADRKAAYEKAAADKKAEYDKRMAERKAAQEKALAERQAAREKALAERKAAQEKAAAQRNVRAQPGP